jgi:hypothetical protein
MPQICIEQFGRLMKNSAARHRRRIHNMASWQHGLVLPNCSDGIATMAGDVPYNDINKVY